MEDQAGEERIPAEPEAATEQSESAKEMQRLGEDIPAPRTAVGPGTTPEQSQTPGADNQEDERFNKTELKRYLHRQEVARREAHRR